MYFATYEGKGENRRVTQTHGALWVLDAVATGKTLQMTKLEKLFDLMNSTEHLNAEKTLPLIYHPKIQTHQPRAANQMPVYIAQMDYRYDLADLWVAYENEQKKKLFITLIMLNKLKSTAAKYLAKAGVTEGLVYPE